MKKNVSLLLLFFIITGILTYPLFFKLSTCIPGFASTDEPFAALWDSWRIKHTFFNGMGFKHTDLAIFPFGLDFFTSGYTSYLWTGLTFLLSIIFNPVLTYNIQVIFNFLSAAFFMYALVFYLSGSRQGAFFSSLAFAFCPYQFVRAWQHLGLSYNQWIPLVLLGAILLKEKGKRKNALLFFFSLILLFSFDWSIMYLGSITLFLFLIYTLVYSWKNKLKKKCLITQVESGYFKKVVLIGLIAFIVLSAQFLPVILNRVRLSSTAANVFNPYHRPFEDLFEQSAKPLSYLLPASSHPLFGKFTEQFIGSFLYGDSLTEHTLYLGWIPLILAFIAFREWHRRRKRKTENRESEKQNFYIGFFVFLSISAWLFSQPPWWQIGPLRIYMPSSLMYKILPMYRAYCRFGIVLMLAVSVLAGFGLKFIIEKKGKAGKKALFALFSGLLLFEFWSYPPLKSIDVTAVPSVYYWLREEPKETILAEYPLDADTPNDLYKIFQIQHKKRMINGSIPGTYPNRVAKSAVNLSEARTAGILKSLGVKYVLVHHDGYLLSELIEQKMELEKIPKNKGLKFIKSFPSEECADKNIMCVKKNGIIDVYEVTAAPIKPDIDY